ncbi:unnamed protein product, partial [Phaeothamnion confervicola]
RRQGVATVASDRCVRFWCGHVGNSHQEAGETQKKREEDRDRAGGRDRPVAANVLVFSALFGGCFCTVPVLSSGHKGGVCPFGGGTRGKRRRCMGSICQRRRVLRWSSCCPSLCTHSIFGSQVPRIRAATGSKGGDAEGEEDEEGCALPLPEGLGNLGDVMESCWCIDPAARPTFARIGADLRALFLADD